MRKKCAAGILWLLLAVLIGALAVSGECAQAADHGDFAAEHGASLIHCRDVFLISNSQAASTIQSHSSHLSKVLPSIHQKFDNVVSVAWFKDDPFREPFSQQELFRFEEVYRL